MIPAELGRLGEERAADYLQANGYLVLDRNYRFMRGEIDIVATDGDHIVFVEVKTRRSHSFGPPQDSVDEKKQKQLLKVAEAWLYERRMEKSRIRFDVIAVMNPGNKKEQLTHIKDAFW